MRMLTFLVVGVGIGILIGYAISTGSDGPPSPDDVGVSQDNPQRPHLSMEAALREQVSSLTSRLNEQDGELASLGERLAGMISAERARAQPRTPFEDTRLRELTHYFDQTRWTYEDALRSSAGSSSQIQRYIVAMPEADVEGFVADVWAERVKRMESRGLILTEAQCELVRGALHDGWLAYRKFMHEDYKPRMEGAETEADVVKARKARQSAWGQAWATLNHRLVVGMQEFPDGKMLLKALGPYL